MQQVTIETGDSLYTLAHKYLGDESQWRSLGEKLKISVFDPLITGQKITIPDKVELLNITIAQGEKILSTELKKLYPSLDLSALKIGNKVDEISIIDWIL
jgi:LysM repeat protein